MTYPTMPPWCHQPQTFPPICPPAGGGGGGGGFAGGPTPAATFPPVCGDPAQAAARMPTIDPASTCGFVCNTLYPPCGPQQQAWGGGGEVGGGGAFIRTLPTNYPLCMVAAQGGGGPQFQPGFRDVPTIYYGAGSCVPALCSPPDPPTMFGQTCPVELCDPSGFQPLEGLAAGGGQFAATQATTLFGRSCPIFTCPTIVVRTCPQFQCPPTLSGRTCPVQQCGPTLSGNTCPTIRCLPTLQGITCPEWQCPQPTLATQSCDTFRCPAPTMLCAADAAAAPPVGGVPQTLICQPTFHPAGCHTLGGPTCPVPWCRPTLFDHTCIQAVCTPTITGKTCVIAACRPTLFQWTCPQLCRPTINPLCVIQPGPVLPGPQQQQVGFRGGVQTVVGDTCPFFQCAPTLNGFTCLDACPTLRGNTCPAETCQLITLPEVCTPTLSGTTCPPNQCIPISFGMPNCGTPTMTGQTCPVNFCPPQTINQKVCGVTIQGLTCTTGNQCIQPNPTLMGASCPPPQCIPSMFGSSCLNVQCPPPNIPPPAGGQVGVPLQFHLTTMTDYSCPIVCQQVHTLTDRTCPAFCRPTIFCPPTVTGHTCPYWSCQPTLGGGTSCPLSVCFPKW